MRVEDAVLRYAIALCEATRTHPMVECGISPRGISALVRLARAGAVLRDRNYVIPEDIQYVFADVCAHRLVLRPQARVDGVSAREVLAEIMKTVRPAAGAVRSLRELHRVLPQWLGLELPAEGRIGLQCFRTEHMEIFYAPADRVRGPVRAGRHCSE